ncbi:hypothetical protein FHETE_6199 [Fusarium heterosporum]|uniref:LYR motif-containing protein Cup1-like N-terminal domain-containing protein n=1 Tax=Fusarium heterosporum TaxID=42747 RepID=A0A8H5TCE7_FUSHE|nr:hypothetical protein FHETE_6199 [Fusarium heterosporum]
MPRPHAIIPRFLPPLSLYRHILRETSYLPPAIRPEVTAQIRTRFRAHRKNENLRQKHYGMATKTLRHLRAANSGESHRMESLMMKAFGRTGAKRRSLLSNYVKLENSQEPAKLKNPSNSNALETLIKEVEVGAKSRKTNAAKPARATLKVDSPPNEQDTKDSNSRPSDKNEATPNSTKARRGPKPLQPAFYHKWDTDKLGVHLAAQRQFQDSTSISWPKNTIKSLKPDKNVLEKNIWGQPTTENVIQAKRARFWKRAATKIMPPVDNEQWELLSRLSKGAQEEQEQWRVPARRPAAKVVLSEESKPSTLDWNWESYATHPTNRIERKSQHTAYSFVGMDREKHPYQSRIEHKELTPRWFRRAYQRVWQYTPRVAPASTSKTKNTYEFGTLPIATVPASKAQLEIFEGVGKEGRKPRNITPSREAQEPKPEPQPETRP